MKDVVPEEPTDYFAQAEWSRLTNKLRTIAESIVKEAKNRRIYTSSSSRWPKIRLERRVQLYKVRSVTLSLQPDYLHDHAVFWEVWIEEIRHLWPVLYKLVYSSVLTVISDAELDDVSRVVEELDRIAQSYLTEWSHAIPKQLDDE